MRILSVENYTSDLEQKNQIQELNWKSLKGDRVCEHV